MQKLITFIIILLCSLTLHAQHKHFTLGKDGTGISVGTFDEYNGINFSLASKSKKGNGFGLALASIDSISKGLKIGLVAGAIQKHTGVSIGAFTCIAGSKLSGLGIAGIACIADTMNGCFISGLGSMQLNSNLTIKEINGVSIGMLGASAVRLNGVSLGYQCGIEYLKGLSIGLLENYTYETRGVQIGALNKTKNLHGLMIGLWNIAENKRHLRSLPFINFNLRKG